MTAWDTAAVQQMRVWHIAKLCGKSPAEVKAWPVEDFLWSEAIESYLQQQQVAQIEMARQRRSR